MRDKDTLFLLVFIAKSRVLKLYGVIKLHQFLLVQDVSLQRGRFALPQQMKETYLN